MRSSTVGTVIYTKTLFFLYVPACSLQFHISHPLVSTSAMSRACAGLPISNTLPQSCTTRDSISLPESFNSSSSSFQAQFRLLRQLQHQP
ncbi:hypothetical protein B0H10DRAFT_2109168 [Mycena sp. CBHHK59/15]|nr:hypothetical protein B0H10DRAFT_2109168 [Mycena sp. CBHHK59/15]